jgi:predicted small lipoprotein YifL
MKKVFIVIAAIAALSATTGCTMYGKGKAPAPVVVNG